MRSSSCVRCAPVRVPPQLRKARWNGLLGLDAATGLVKRTLNNRLSEVLKRERETAHVRTLVTATRPIGAAQQSPPRNDSRRKGEKEADEAAHAGAQPLLPTEARPSLACVPTQ